MKNKFNIPGQPATYSTKAEKPWKEALAFYLPYCVEKSPVLGLNVHFYLTKFKHNGQPFDLDNLCDPVFSILVNKLKWFGGSRRNMIWWRASRCQSTNNGCDIQVYEDEVCPVSLPKSEKIFEMRYSGKLPVKATDPCLTNEIMNKMPEYKLSESDRYMIYLRFENNTHNIGDIVGKTKHIIDSLYPILGGKAGHPDDWKIDTLQVEKASGLETIDGLLISVWKTV